MTSHVVAATETAPRKVILQRILVLKSTYLCLLSLFIIMFYLLFTQTAEKSTASSTIVDVEAEVKDID